MRETRHSPAGSGPRTSRFGGLSLRRKVALLGLVQLAALMLCLGTGLYWLIRQGVRGVEDREVQSTVTRINRLFEQTAADTERSVHDYAIWDDSYAFVAHPTPKFVEDNLSQDVLSNLHLSDDFILDRDLRVVAGKSLPPGAEAIQELDPRVAEAVRPLASALLQGPAISAASLVQVGGELRLAAACRVLPTRPTRPFNGIFVHVKRVDAPLLQSFSHLVEGELSLSQDPALIASFSLPDTPFRILERTPQSLRIALPVRDSQGRVLAVLESPFPRTLRLLAHRFMLMVYASLFAILAAMALLLPMLLRRIVLDRLEGIHAFVAALGGMTGTAPRLPERAGDELDALASGINRGLDSLESAQQLQLEAEREQRRIEEQLFQNQKFEAIATMAGGIAHDFNNGLSCILGSLDLLQDDLGEGHPGQRHIERMRKAGVLSTTLVRQMLNLTRTGHAHLAFVRLGETVSEALKLVRAGLPRSIEIQFENLALDDQVMVDTIHLQQVVMNLATNAAHAMSGKPEGCIRVAIRETPLPCADDYPETLSLAPGTYLRLSFSDNGHGIPAELLGKVFDPFFTTKPIGSGTGLGLPVAQAFASRHGGAIGVKSAPEEGATFTLHLPKKCAPKYEPRLAGIQGLRLLLVDDDAHGREAMAEGLRRASHSVTEAMGGSSALRLFEEDPEGFDAVITDQIMPGMTGLDLAEQVHCLAPHVPVFLISGYQGTLAPGALEAKGILRVFPKPVTIAELDRAIREAQLER